MHPTLYLLSVFLSTALAVGYTNPKSQLRFVGFVFVAFCVFRCVPSCMSYMERTPWAGLVGGHTVTCAYHYIDVALLSRWSYKHLGPTNGLVKLNSSREDLPKRSTTVFRDVIDRLLFGLRIASSSRFIGTPYQARNTSPPVSAERKRFLFRTCGVVVLSYVVLDLIQSANDPAIGNKYLTLEKVSLLSRLGDVTIEELVIRAFTVLAAGVGLICVQGGIYHVLALLAVALMISMPTEWPPFYGSFTEAYTLQGFWK